MGQLISESGHRFLRTLNKQGLLKDDELQLCITADEEDDPNMILGYFTYRPDYALYHCPICAMPTSLCAFPDQHEKHWYKSGLQLHQWQIDQLMCKNRDMYDNYASTITILGGPGCGKSTFLAVAIGWLMCAFNPGFVNLTAAPTAKQNDAVISEYSKWIENTRGWDVFMADQPSVARPVYKYQFRNGSEHRIFTTAALSAGAQAADRILSLEGDVVAYDEAGIDPNFANTLQVLGSRTRGLRPDGSHRGMRYPDGTMRTPMYIISNPHEENVEFDEFVNIVSEMRTFSLVEVDTAENRALTDNQVNDITQRVIASYLISGGTEEDAMNAMGGRQATGDGEVFSRKAILSVISGDYKIEEYILSHLIGPQRTDNNFTFLLPKEAKHTYLITCDPGVGGAPRRNAPVIMLWDITVARQPVLVGLYWGSPVSGEPGFYLQTLADWIKRFRAYAYVDTTGPQAVLMRSAELSGLQQWIVPVDLSGSFKGTAQWIMQMATGNAGYILPKLPQPYTFERYMRRYRWKDDKITQDLIVGILLLTLWQHQVVSLDDEEEIDENRDKPYKIKRHVGHVRGKTVATR